MKKISSYRIGKEFVTMRSQRFPSFRAQAPQPAFTLRHVTCCMVSVDVRDTRSRTVLVSRYSSPGVAWPRLLGLSTCLPQL